MLIEFSVENFKCFAEKQTLDMRPDPDITSLDENLIRTGLMYKDEDEQGKEKELLLLPSVAIYGANASGKSSLIEALVDTTELTNQQKDFTPISDETFFFNKKPSSNALHQIAITREGAFLDDSVVEISTCFLGSCTYSESSKKTAPLSRQVNMEKSLPYNLDLVNTPVINFNSFVKTLFKGYPYYVFYRNYYYLNEILEKSQPDKRGWFWLRDTNHYPLIQALLDPVQKTKLEKLLEKADFNISNIKVESKNDGAETVYFLTFKINGQTTRLPFRNQSQGTKQFLLIMPTIVHVLETGAVLLADELEAHLHPDLCRAIIELFNNPETNPKGSQLIFTTHNQDFMASSLMRPDQIYFVNKDQSTGASEVYRASDFEDFDWFDMDLTVKKAYHYGLLGSSPRVRRLTGDA